MPTFEYSGKNSVGHLMTGEVMAATPQEAVHMLRKQELFITRLQEKIGASVGAKETPVQWPFIQRVSSKELVGFTHQLATLIRAGVPLLECLDLLSSEAGTPRFKQVLRVIREKVEGGSFLAQALSHYPDIFPPIYVSLVEVGESTGRLDESLIQLAQYVEKQTRLRAKILSALAYPALLVGVALSVLVFLCVWVVPLFSELFSEMGEALPWLTLVVISLAEGMRDYGVSVLVLGGLVFWGVRGLLRSPGIRETQDAVLLTIPVIGPVLRKAAVVRVARTLGSLVQHGLPLLQAVDLTRGVIGNVALERGLHQALQQVEQGLPLSEALRAQGPGLFPSMMTQMIKVGESTGSMDAMLGKIADLFEQEVDRSIVAMTALVEPAIILLVGSAIAVVVIAMYLPIFSMGSIIG
ncbi:MAG: type II secretion system F family protein [Nitrospirales bacterium]|nr:type II secretion system F family protein [Nitrospirales bacterium]